MNINTLYPYWVDVHSELIELLEWVPEAVWDYKPRPIDARSVKQIVLHIIEMERFWMVHLAQGASWDPPLPSDFRTPSRLIEGLLAARAQTHYFIENLQPATLRAVRTVPADPETNMPETNRPVEWLIWQTVQHEIYHYGQIQQRRYEVLARG